MEHTKGTWKVSQEHWDYGTQKIVAFDGPGPEDYWDIASVAGGADSNDLGGLTEQEANARLIAAAPKQNDALHDIQLEAGKLTGHNWYAIKAKIIKLAQAAIASATSPDKAAEAVQEAKSPETT